MENKMNEQTKSDYGTEQERTMNENSGGSQALSGRTQTPQEEDCRSQSLRSEVREEHAMDNDVEPLHSEGDEPDLEKYLKEIKNK